MKLSSRLAYRSFALISACSVALASWVLLADPNAVPPAGAAVLAMAFALGYGLFIALPSIHSEDDEHAKLSTRAAELELAAHTDPLTGLYNRRYFDDAIENYFQEFKKSGAPLALLTIDLDRFKTINDTYGHQAGDKVLKQVGVCLKALTRDADVVARLGGDEFAIIAPFSQPEHVGPFAERVCRSIAELRVDTGDAVIRPTVSVGVACLTKDCESSADLLERSDQRLYQAKTDGRNAVAA